MFRGSITAKRQYLASSARAVCHCIVGEAALSDEFPALPMATMRRGTSPTPSTV